MSDMYPHHTKEQAKQAFVRAQEILEELVNAGVELPRFELFLDGSGRLILESTTWESGEIILQTTQKQWELAKKLVRSNRLDTCMGCLGKPPDYRPVIHRHEVAIRFCCGLVEHL